MVNVGAVIDELSTVMDKPAAEKLAQVIASLYEQIYESVVTQRLNAVEQAIQNVGVRLEQVITALQGVVDAVHHQGVELSRYREASDARFARIETTLVELTEAQKRTEDELVRYREASDARFARIETTLAELTEAQKRTEDELARYREASDARFARIETTLAELTEAQKRTEETVARLSQRVDELTATQRAMQAQMQEMNNAIRRLAEAQARSERFLQSVARKQDDLAKQWGGLSFSLGYPLENEAYKHLPPLLARDFGLVVEGRLKRELFEDAQGPIEANIYGSATRNGERVTIVGESKVQLSRKDVDQFLKRKLPRLRNLFGDVFPVLVTHMTSQIGVKEYANEQGIALYHSYDF